MSVVLLSGGREGDLARVLDATVPTCRELGVSVVAVVEDEALVRDFHVRFPEVEFVVVGSGVPMAERRGTALPAAGGDLVIFVDDRTALQPGWSLALARRAGNGRFVSPEPSTDWSRELAERGVPGALDGI